MATKTQTNVQSALTADPSVNFVIPIYDVLSQWVVPAVTIAGRADKVKIATFNGTPFAIGLVQEGKVDVDIGENLDWIGRAVWTPRCGCFAGCPRSRTRRYPLLIFDKDNADTAGKPPKVNTGYGDAYVDGYRQLWKLR